ncbi:hypothetical protein ACWDZ8_33360 [Streptomyces sp. NPDC003233]
MLSFLTNIEHVAPLTPPQTRVQMLFVLGFWLAFRDARTLSDG